MSDYERIATAIAYVADNATRQPSLEEMAARAHLSPYHFQRLFCRWAGTTPKRFMQMLTLEHGKVLLDEALPVLEVAQAVGLSSSSRLHDHFVTLAAVTPGEYKSKGKNLRIEYGCHASPFGSVFIAMTRRGVCQAVFMDGDDMQVPLRELAQAWPLAALVHNQSNTSRVVAGMFGPSRAKGYPLSLHVAGTNFQVAVWRALLQIPAGKLASYQQVAAALGRPGAARAVGGAVGKNPVAFLVPCHRVIRQSGALGGYRWGQTRKRMIQLWERVQ